MNKRLSDAISRLNELSRGAAEMQIAVLLLRLCSIAEEADRCSDAERRSPSLTVGSRTTDFASEDEANEFFGRLKA